MANAFASIREYSGGSSDEEQTSTKKSRIDEELNLHLKDVNATASLKSSIRVWSSPPVVSKESFEAIMPVDEKKELLHNPKYEELYKPELGPENPFRTCQQKAVKNNLAGFVEPSHISNFEFEVQRRTFHSYGYAVDPSTGGISEPNKVVGDIAKFEEMKGATVFEKTRPRHGDSRQRHTNNDPSDIGGYLGPWGKFIDEKIVMKPSEEEKKDLDEILAKRSKNSKRVEDKPIEEKSILHLREPVDYQGRSFMHIPTEVGVNLRADEPPDRCFIPKHNIHVWTGHNKQLNAIRWFPKSAHLLLSCSMDHKIKIWEVYGERRCVRTYIGHNQGVRDICFNNSGAKFLSCAYDRYCKLWDTETGACLSRFSSGKIPYCIKFHPEEGKQDFFVAGTSDKKIVCWDVRSGEIVQEYDRHLGAVNTITFVDLNRRFVSTSDDKSLRVWEWDIPVDFKYIADPSMHSMPAVTLSPNGKWLGCQSMDNQIVMFNALNRFKFSRKKVFKGHMVAGFACGLDFSPEMSYVISGDADGKLYVWDWKTTKLYEKFKAHDDVCISCLWHPHETSKIATAGWDGLIKFWD